MKHNTMKKTIAGAMTLLCVAAYMPVDMGGLLTAGTEIVANAEGETINIKTLADDYYKRGCILTAGTTISFEGVGGSHRIYLYAPSGEFRIIRVESTYTLEREYWVRDGYCGSGYASVHLHETGDANTFVENNGVYTSNTADKKNTVADYSFTAESAGPLYWKVDSEEGFDDLFIYVNGERKLRESGANKTGSLNLNAGDAVRVLYSKDSGGSENSDCAKFRFDKPFPTLSYHAAVAPGCTTNGSVACWYDETNQVYYLDADGVTEATYSDDIVVSATGHTYGAPVWNWSDDYTQASAVFACEKDDSTEKVQAVVTSVVEGKTMIYTAKVTINGKEYTDVREAELEDLIQAQPEDVTVVSNQNVVFSVEAAEGSTYQWYYRRSASAAWTRVTNNGTSASYTTSGSAARDGWQFYCEVTKDGRTENSEAATLHYETLITAQPEDITIHSRQNVTFEVASIEGCTYQWYYRKSATSRWILVANNGASASYTTVGSADRDGWQFCCKVMKGDASVLSGVATLNYESLITAQPEDAASVGRQNVTFEVESIEGSTYQWYYRKSATSRWILVANNGTSASYTTAGLASRDGWQFCCKVMKDGASELSDVATLNYQSLVTAQPEDAAISARRNVTFEVASVTGCAYQWFYRKSADSRWIMVRNNGTSASYTTVGNADRDGWQFCCKVMQGDASELSEVATLHYQAVK